MTQEERWQQQYEQMMSFMETYHRRPSEHRLEEHDMLNWFKATKKDETTKLLLRLFFR
ncbi:MAG: hypothetical protein IJV17_05280 [Prevotella sp.]|nr:hypothetical protein [Prevotella sp.]